MKKAQIWVETIIYTLIALTIIGVTLGIAKPKILEFRDKIAIERGLSMLTDLHSTILDAATTVGNVRIFMINLRKGRIEINSSSDSIMFVLENAHVEFSEPNREIPYGDITLKTIERHGTYEVRLWISYENHSIDILYGGNNNTLQQISAAATPYKLRIETINETAQTMTVDLSLIS